MELELKLGSMVMIICSSLNLRWALLNFSFFIITIIGIIYQQNTKYKIVHSTDQALGAW